MNDRPGDAFGGNGFGAPMSDSPDAEGEAPRDGGEAPQEPWWATPPGSVGAVPAPSTSAAPSTPAGGFVSPSAPSSAPPGSFTSPDRTTRPFERPYGDTYARPAHSALPYGEPAATAPVPSYSLSSYGQPYGHPPYGQPPSHAYGQPAESKPDRGGKRWLLSLVIVALVAALVGGGVGAGVVAATKHDNKAANTASTATTTATAGANNSASPVVPTLPAGSVASVAQAMLPSVVSIIVSGPQEQDEGTGIILTADGEIVTNNHVVEAAATSGTIAVTFSDGHSVTASILGRDPTSDLAVIKAQNTSGLHPAKLGSDATLVVGQQVVAVGSPLGLSNSVTSGIISSLNRPVCTQNCNGGGSTPTVLDAIQTDAAINPGNSGGPLVDMAGRVVGINSAIATTGQGGFGGQAGNIGVGFAIPIDEASRVIDELVKTGHASHAVIGIGVNDSVDPNLNTPNGAKVVSVTPGGPAAAAGMRVGDVIVNFNNRAVVDGDSLIAATHAAAPNSTVPVTVARAGEKKTIQVTLGSATSA